MTEKQEAVSLPRNKGGRPRKLTADKATIDQIVGMASIFCTKAEVAAVLRVSRPTLDKFFADYPEVEAAYEDGIGTGKMSLRRKQFKLADKNPAMAIFLGKNMLGQSDRIAHFGGGPDDGPIQYANLTEEEIDARLAALINPGAEDPVPAAGKKAGGAGANGGAVPKGKTGRGRKKAGGSPGVG